MQWFYEFWYNPCRLTETKEKHSMISIAVVDDEISALEETKKCLYKYFAENNEGCSISEFTDPLSFSENYSAKFDILFLDIQMAGKNGIDLARLIRESDKTTVIVFVTNMANLAVKGYEVDASDFIVKPLEYFSFKIKMDRIMERVNQNLEKGSILISTEEGKMKVNPSSIYYIEVYKHSLVYHLTDGNYSAYGSLTNIEKELGDDFSRPANCYLVNLRHVKKIDGFELYLAGKDEIHLTMSRTKKKQFMEDLTRYIGKGKIYVL